MSRMLRAVEHATMGVDAYCFDLSGVSLGLSEGLECF